jgi:hypothetical protein
MLKIDRRAMLGAAGLAVAAAGARAEETQRLVAAAAPVAPKDVTRTLARYVVGAKYEDLPANVRKEGLRTLLNWVGVAIGGSHHETVDIAVQALAPFSGPAQASLFGRKERFDIMNAAFINGVSSHIFDYDDTHLKTVIHPGGRSSPRSSPMRKCIRCRARISSTRWCSASRRNAGSATRSIPITMTSAGTSPARPACSAARRRPASSWG